jgi:hypothetical protein
MKDQKVISREIIDRFFESDIPYRLDMLNAMNSKIWDDINFRRCSDYVKLKICAVEASRIVQRVFIQFMGLQVQNNELISIDIDKKKDDVYITHLGGKLVEPENLTASEKDILIKAYITGNKSTAHLTFNPQKNTGYPEVLKPGAALIKRLLKENLFDVVGREMKSYELS